MKSSPGQAGGASAQRPRCALETERGCHQPQPTRIAHARSNVINYLTHSNLLRLGTAALRGSIELRPTSRLARNPSVASGTHHP